MTMTKRNKMTDKWIGNAPQGGQMTNKYLDRITHPIRREVSYFKKSYEIKIM
jgi:hypothetical protein